MDNTFDKKWEGVFALLEKFVGEYSRFPYDEEVYEGFDLGAWCRRQKVRAKKPNYPIERYKKLKSIGLLDATRNNHWEQMFSLLEKFVIEHQRLPKRKEVYEDVNLGRWCGTQIQYAKKPNYPPERRKKLEAIGLLR